MKTPSNFVLVSGLLVLATLLTYAPILEAGFVGFDDTIYVTGNNWVQRGLSWQTATWAATATLDGNWFPLTWLSHAADCQLYGLKPAGHHLTSLLLHLATVLVLLRTMYRMTGDLWPSAVAVALFALHPLHVESVAWVAERKDVLSAFFGVLSLHAFARYAAVRQPRRHAAAKWYSVSLFFFACGLMSKPMLVTLPCVMLLLDWWPLRRLRGATVARLVLEKAPFFLLTGISSWITFKVQKTGGAMTGTEQFVLASRVGNALVSYVRYLGKTVWPQDLAVFYPHPGAWPVWAVAAAAALLLGISLLTISRARQHPYLVVGWFWYLGMLVPVIGLVQVGLQAMADRYTYLPLIGIFLIAAWGTFHWGRLLPSRAQLITGGAAIVLAACALATHLQLRYWENGVTLFEHALAVTPANALSLTGLGNALERMGRIDEAMAQYRDALKLEPENARANYNLANCLFQQKRLTESIPYFERTLRVAPEAIQAHNNLGVLLAQLGRAAEAAGHFRKVLIAEPDNPEVHYNLALALRQLGPGPEVVRHLKDVVRLKPQDAHALLELALAELDLGDDDSARAHLGQGLALEPALLIELNNRAWRLATHPDAASRDGKKAAVLASAALDYSGPRRAMVLDTLAAACAETGEFISAMNYASEALSLARTAGDSAFAEEISRRLAVYQQQQAWREPARSAF